MNSMAGNPGDTEAIRRLLAESGVEGTPDLDGALLELRAAASSPAPAPNAELEAFFTAGVTPLRRPSRRRGYLLGAAIIAAMAAGTTGVAAANGGLWITAEDTQNTPAPVNFEQVPAPTPGETKPAAVPQVLPAAEEAEPDPAAEVPAAPAPAETEPPGRAVSEPGPDAGPGSGRDEHHDAPGGGRAPEGPAWQNGQGHGRDGDDGRDNGNGKATGRDNGNGKATGRDNGNGKNQGQGNDTGRGNGDGNDNGRDNPGKNGRDDNRGGPPHGNGPSRGSD